MRRVGAFVLAAALIAVACTEPVDDPNGEVPPPSSASSSPRPAVPVGTGPTSARQAMRRLCTEIDVTVDPVKKRPTPPAIAEVESQVESVRGLTFKRPVNVEPITDEEIDRRIAGFFEVYYPKRFYARRTQAWATIGAIPGDVGILEALARYQRGQVLGFYNSQNEELVYTGDAQLNRIEQFVLAHELTHAIDDQHFDLDRLDGLSLTCDDERFQAALGVVEGSANHFATQVIFRYPITEIGDFPASSAGGVPPLIVDIQAYPYTDGQVFVDHLADDGGVAAVNGALKRFPTTTEQVLHPAKFRRDEPTEVDVPDFAPTFGKDWRDLDVMIVGEMWLRATLDTGLEGSPSASAAAGWDGGIYRAWSDGEQVAVILATVWDTQRDAAEFREALGTWTERRSDRVVIVEEGKGVNAGFASSPRLMDALESAVRSL